MAKRIKNSKNLQKRAIAIRQNDTLINAIFKANVKLDKISNDDLRMIFKDLTFTQSDASRKSVTEKKSLDIICDDESVSLRLKESFNPDIISQVLETYLYGLNVFEVNYKLKDGLFYPVLVQRDFRDFSFDDGELKFNGSGFNVDIPPYKVIYALNRANFAIPYGDALLEKLYFPVKLKNTSLKFWIQFLEKFGSPWAVAKTSWDAQGLASELYSMLAGDAAVIDEDESIEITQPAKDSAHDKLISYCDNQIAKAILGGNLTAQVSGGSFAATETHNKIREDIARNDENILAFVIKRAIKFFKIVNDYKGEIELKIYDTKPNLELADRDLKLYNMGFVPTSEYIKNTYNYEIDEAKSNNDSLLKANKIALKDDKKAFKSSLKPKYFDKFDEALDNKEFLEATEKIGDELESSLNKILAECKNYEDAFDKFRALYNEYPLDILEELMFKAIANSQIVGFEEDGV